MQYIEKRIYSGRVLEIEKYPVNQKGNRLPRMNKGGQSTNAQTNLNEKNARKHLTRLINANFDKNDLFITISYSGNPPTKMQAKKDFQNLIRRLRYLRQKEKLPDLKYAGISHVDVARPHHHLIINAMSWDLVKSLWDKGRIHISNLTPTEYGFEEITRYILDDKNKNAFAKRWCASKNLNKPIIQKKIIKRLNIYKRPPEVKGYKIIDVDVTDNVFMGTYQYIRLIKLE